MGERLPRGEHGQNPGRRSFRVPDLVPGRRNQSEGVSRPFLVRGHQAHAGEDIGHEQPVVRSLGESEGLGEVGTSLVVPAGVEVRPPREPGQLRGDAVQTVPEGNIRLLSEKPQHVTELADDGGP